MTKIFIIELKSKKSMVNKDNKKIFHIIYYQFILDSALDINELYKNDLNNYEIKLIKESICYDNIQEIYISLLKSIEKHIKYPKDINSKYNFYSLKPVMIEKIFMAKNNFSKKRKV